MLLIHAPKPLKTSSASHTISARICQEYSSIIIHILVLRKAESSPILQKPPFGPKSPMPPLPRALGPLPSSDLLV